MGRERPTGRPASLTLCHTVTSGLLCGNTTPQTSVIKIDDEQGGLSIEKR
ncbi:hypothetical protein [Kutzneria sp. NPDC051319]